MTDKPIRFSKAPPPIVPINATGYRPPSKPKPIDWEHWRLMPIVELQQAVELSVNVNPDDVTLVNDVVIRRMEIALSHVQAKTLTLDSHYPNVPLSRVSLAKFAAWALKLGIPNLPPELIAMAATEPTTAPDGDDLARRDFLARKNPDTPHSPEYLTAQALYYRGEADRLDKRIKELDKASAPTVREVAEKQRTLSELTAKHHLMNEDALFWESQQPAPAQTPATPAPVVAASDGTAPALPNWKMRVQAEATELFIRLLASGANPTPHSILDSLVTWCRDNEIKTAGKNGGINPSNGYLRTHVLGGGHWTPPTMSREQAKRHVAQVAQTKVAQVAQ